MKINLKDMVLKGTLDVLIKAFNRFAKEQKITVDKVQIWIGTHSEENGWPFYRLVFNGKPFTWLKPDECGVEQETEEVPFEMILGSRNDLLQTGPKAGIFLAHAIMRFAVERNTDARNIEIQIITPEGSEDVFPIPFLYDLGIEGEDKLVRQLRLDGDIFTQEEGDKIFDEMMQGAAGE